MQICERHCFCIVKYIWNLYFLKSYQSCNHCVVGLTNQRVNNNNKKKCKTQKLRILKQLMDQIPHIHPFKHTHSALLHISSQMQNDWIKRYWTATIAAATTKILSSVSFVSLEMSKVHTFGRSPSVSSYG